MNKMMVLLLTGMLISAGGCTQPDLTTMTNEELFTHYKTASWSRQIDVGTEIQNRMAIDVQKIIADANSFSDFTEHSIREQLKEKWGARAYMYHVSMRNVQPVLKQWYIENHDLDLDTEARISGSENQYRHLLKLGMSEQEVIAAIGFPRDINTSTGRWGVHEQWIYGGSIGGAHFSTFYFYFEDGILTAMQD